MAIYHCSVKIGTRAKGQSAIAASAYRSGKKLKDNETGLISDYTQKKGIVYSEVSLCAHAPSEYQDREILWNEVHKIEKASNSQLWREFEVALPKELNLNQQIETVRDFVKGLNEQGMCVDWSIHDKQDGNPHAHIMTTMRSIMDDGMWAPKSKKVYDLDENGERIFQKIDKTGRKQYKSHKENYNNWNDKERIEEWRTAWEICCNSRLDEHNHIDHRSYERQGIDQEPTIHEGFVARKLVAQGKTSGRVQINEEIRERNKLLKKLAEGLKSIGEELKSLIEQKGSVINAGKQRITDLLERRIRTVNKSDGRFADRERESERRVKKAAPSESDIIVRQSKLERRAAEEFLRDKETDSKQSGRFSEFIRNGETDTDSFIRQSQAKVDSATADRKNRDAERERLAAEESKRIREAEQRAREIEREREQEKNRRSRGFSR